MSRNVYFPMDTDFAEPTRRVFAKLVSWDLTCPVPALEQLVEWDPGFPGNDQVINEFERLSEVEKQHILLQQALEDAFETDEFICAAAMIGPGRKEPLDWHSIDLLDENLAPGDLTDATLCPSKLDAMSAVLAACDDNQVALSSYRKVDGSVLFTINGEESVAISPVLIEPFNPGIRDRVRTAFKGVKERDTKRMSQALERLPGFPQIGYRARTYHASQFGKLVFGYPANWGGEMRRALGEIGIEVKLSQAQEFAAVFLADSSYHMMTRRQKELAGCEVPVMVQHDLDGPRARRFYHTGEEALFACAKAIEKSTEFITLDRVSLALTTRAHLLVRVFRGADVDVGDFDSIVRATCLESGYNDVWTSEDSGCPEGVEATAQRILESLEGSIDAVPIAGMLYAGTSPISVLLGALAREGVPPEQVIQCRENVLVVRYQSDPNGYGLRSAHLTIYQAKGESWTRLHPEMIPMYKAETRILRDGLQLTLEIRGDYGRDQPLLVPIDSEDIVERLGNLCQGEGLFSMALNGFVLEEPPHSDLLASTQKH